MSEELELLIECIQSEGEAEAGGVKYVYMEPSVIYRCAGNRMKKISAALINKANKQIAARNAVPPESVASAAKQPSKQKRQSKKARNVAEQRSVEPALTESDETDDEEEQDDEIPQKHDKSKNASKSKSKAKTCSNIQAARDALRGNVDSFYVSPNINLDEYYNNKNKMEYMNLEITRLNNKVDKLKHYKAIVNKLTGNEFDLDIPAQNLTDQQRQPASESYATSASPSAPQRGGRTYNDSLFMF